MLCLLKGVIHAMHLILICRSLTTAQKSAKVLQRAGIFAAVTKAPQGANPGGCTYGVKIAQRNLEAALHTLERAGIRIETTVEAPELPGQGAL